MSKSSISRVVALLAGAASLSFAIPAQAEWGGGYGRASGWNQSGGYGDRSSPWVGRGHSGIFLPGKQSGQNAGKTCYNIAGKPYTYSGNGRCPIS